MVEYSLKRRVIDIEETVDELIRSLHGVVELKRHFSNVGMLQKLRYLLIMEPELDEEKVIRINDTVQSFDILESPGYHKVKSVEEFIDANKDGTLLDHFKLQTGENKKGENDA